MNFFETHYNGKILLVDAAGSASESMSLESSLVREYLGGAALNRALYDRFRDDDPIVFGTGPLTGGFAPAACLLVATFRSPLTGRITNVPLTLRTGPQVKYAGFDFIVLRKKSSDPKVIVAHNEAVTLSPGETYNGLQLTEMLEQARREFGRPESFVWPGAVTPSLASAATGRGGGFDRRGLAAALAEKNIKALFIYGNDGLPFGADDLVRSDRIIGDMKKNLTKKEVGFAGILDRIGEDQAARAVPRRKVRHMACARCPVPCMSHILVPKGLSGSEGTLLADHLGFAALAKHVGIGVYRLITACNEAGIDPIAVADWLAAGVTQEEALSFIANLVQGKEDNVPTGNRGGDFYGPLSEEDCDFFGGGLPPLYDTADEASIEAWKTRTARAMILGVCPILAARFPMLDAALPSFLADNTEQAKAMEQTLGSLAETVITGT
jgi:aldehyde:ferredoxin oxidoreductase